MEFSDPVEHIASLLTDKTATIATLATTHGSSYQASNNSAV